MIAKIKLSGEFQAQCETQQKVMLLRDPHESFLTGDIASMLNRFLKVYLPSLTHKLGTQQKVTL